MSRPTRRQFGKTDIVHAALDDRMLDPEQFGNGRLHVSLLRFPVS